MSVGSYRRAPPGVVVAVVVAVGAAVAVVVAGEETQMTCADLHVQSNVDISILDKCIYFSICMGPACTYRGLKNTRVS